MPAMRHHAHIADDAPQGPRLFSTMLVVAIIAASALVRLPALGAEVGRASSPPVIDLHVDLSYRVTFKNGALDKGSGQYVASKLASAGVGGVVLPLYVPRDVSPTGPRAEDLERSFAGITALIPRTPPYALPGCEKKDGAVRTWLAFEGAAPLAAEPGAVNRWVARGVRVFGLVHTYDNELATSSGGSTPATSGLTDAGRDLVQRIHRAGAVVDVSHASDAATDEIIGIARRDGVPVVATHSNARALAPHPRNLTDDQIRRIAETGGVVGINFHSRFLVPRGRARLGDVVGQIRYVARLAGIDHVAIGSDFEGDILPPPELRDVSGFPSLARALEESGMAAGDVAKVFGENAERVLCPSPARGSAR
jgi:membrane dipeptidase